MASAAAVSAGATPTESASGTAGHVSKGKSTSSSSSGVYALKASQVTKLGHTVKNWKSRWLLLLNNGLLRYYKKEVPENETKEQPQGEINVTRDCVGLLTHEQLTEEQDVKWPQDTPPNSGFGIETRGGRVYVIYTESAIEAERWLTALASVAANARYKDGGDTIKRIAAQHKSVRKPNERPAQAQVSVEPTVPEEEPGEPEQNICYIHKVVGGVVIKEPVA